jgi:predicted Zn-dependent protease
MARKSFSARLILPSLLVALLGAACDDDLTPREALAESSESFAETESYEVRFEMTIEQDGERTTAEGRAGYEGDTLAYSEQSFSGNLLEQSGISEQLFVPPDLYARASAGDWYVLSPWNQGIRPDELPEFLTDQIVDYPLMTEQLHDIEWLPDQTLDGRDYLRIAGVLDQRGFRSSSPALCNDPAFDYEEVGIVLLLEKKTFLPHKISMEASTGPLRSDVSMETSIQFTDYDGPVTPPEPPAEARPWRDWQMVQTPCTGDQLVSCLEPQAELRAISRPSCEGSGRRVCLVPLGQIRPDLVQHLVQHYGDQYGLSVTVLAPIAVPRDIVDPLREQVDADALFEQIGNSFPEAYRDPEVVLIGITPIDMYSKESHYRYYFGFVGTSADPKAVISTFRMDPAANGEAANDALFFSRVRKLLSKYIGQLYYGLSSSPDPGSPLYDSIMGPSDLDNMREPLPVPRRTAQSTL